MSPWLYILLTLAKHCQLVQLRYAKPLHFLCDCLVLLVQNSDVVLMLTVCFVHSSYTV